jgi:1-acyl-sn-glycerol-3-phosphate acyltransferase
VIGARLRLVSLWVSQTARVLGDWCLLFLAVFAAGQGRESLARNWPMAMAVFFAPFVLLAPLNGWLGNAIPRRWVLTGSALYILLVVGGCAAWGVSLMICLALVGVGAAVYSPARYAMIPAGIEDANASLPRVTGWMEAGSSVAIFGGVALGSLLVDTPAGASLALIGLSALSLVTAWMTPFVSDVPRPEGSRSRVAAFFRDAGRILALGPARGPLLGMAGFQALVVVSSFTLIAVVLQGGAPTADVILQCLGLVCLGTALGSLLASVQGHPRRTLGLVPFATTGCAVALLLVYWSAGPALPRASSLLMGVMAGLIHAPLRSGYLAYVPPDARGNAMSLMNAAVYVATAALVVLLYLLLYVGWLTSPSSQLLFLGLLSVLGTAISWHYLLAHAFEQVLEVILWPIYRIHGHGPGRDRIPMTGPLLIVANHACYMDPLLLGKFVPRRMTPMMLSTFYDLPIIHWLMVHIIQAIRVPESRMRREAPELNEAIAVLRAGGCVLIFPEAILRRTEEVLLRPFGQGIWRILQEVPNTPVVACWIEGGWGSFYSHLNGPPMKNKPMDWWRRIDLVFAEPEVLSPEMLADREGTRNYLRQKVLECRQQLGLPTGPTPGATDQTEQETP